MLVNPFRTLSNVTHPTYWRLVKTSAPWWSFHDLGLHSWARAGLPVVPWIGKFSPWQDPGLRIWALVFQVFLVASKKIMVRSWNRSFCSNGHMFPTSIVCWRESRSGNLYAIWAIWDTNLVSCGADAIFSCTLSSACTWINLSSISLKFRNTNLTNMRTWRGISPKCTPHADTDKHRTLSKCWESLQFSNHFEGYPWGPHLIISWQRRSCRSWGKKKHDWKVIECNTKEVTHRWGLEVQVKLIHWRNPSLRNRRMDWQSDASQGYFLKCFGLRNLPHIVSWCTYPHISLMTWRRDRLALPGIEKALNAIHSCTTL